MSPGIDVLPGDAVSDESLRKGMIAGFTGYAVPMQPSAEAFGFMMRQRGLDRACSRIALADGRVVAVWFVSRAGAKAYLIASGTDPAYRGKGLARQLAEASMQELHVAGARHFRTEVMAGNDVAAGLYRRLGMEVERELSCFDLGPLDATAHDFDLERVPWAAVRQDAEGCRDWPPTWQNDDAALSRVAPDVTCLASRDGQGLAGYAALVHPANTVAQIAVRPDRRRAGLGRALLEGLLAQHPGGTARIINADARDEGFAAFMTAVHARPMVSQHGLIGPLSDQHAVI